MPESNPPSNQPRLSAPQIAFAVVVVLYVAYAAAFIARTSFSIDGVRHFCLFDDAMISMRYARNLAEGQGPVWNAGGDRVEGYTNPLWTVTMATLAWLPLSMAKACLPVQILGALLLVANLFVVRAIARRMSPCAPWVAVGAAALTAFYLPLNNWALQGMEVGAAALLVSSVTLLALRRLEDDRFSRLLYPLASVAVLLRLDLVVPMGMICAYLMLFDRRYRLRHAIAGGIAIALGLGLQTAFRYAYYGDLLPNTYYLKMTGYPALLRISRGLLVLGDFIRAMNPLAFALPWLLLPLRRDRKVGLLTAVVAGQMAYSVYVGGDAWEWWGGANRYISVAMPLFFVLACCTVDLLFERLLAWHRDAAGPAVRPFARRQWLFAVAVVLLLLSTNSLRGPASLQIWALIERPLHVTDNEQMVRRAYILRDITKPNARIALVWAGIMPYFADREIVDISGKNDRHIARLPAHRAVDDSKRFRHFHPGHLKWDYHWSIAQMQPDVALQVEYPPGEAETYLVHDYRRVLLDGTSYFVRNDSPALRWDRIAKLQRQTADHLLAKTDDED